MLSFDQIGDQGRQRVVVTEFQLVQRHGVVFVDDRQDTLPQQFFDRHARVARPLAVLEIGAGKQHLGRGYAMFGERFAVRLHEQRLAYRGGRLFLMQQLGPLGVADFAEAGGHGAGGDEQGLVSGPDETGQLGGEITDGVPV
ncbi:hypothetical protein HMSSN036_52560 [Paenibacillus macerans]|nr:hypothetical protein HMSSN036_52560 [Paenibacillus macerans]